MRFADACEEVLSAFRKQKLRTSLTAAGIAIGAFAITLMVGLGQGLQTYIERQFLALQDDRTVMVFPSFFKAANRLFDRFLQIGQPATRLTDADEEERRVRRGGLWITEEQLDALRSMDGIERVAPMSMFTVDGIALVDADTAHAGYYSTDFATLCNSPLVGELAAGRMPSEDSSLEVVLSPQYAQSFGIEPAALLGREVKIRVPKMSGITRRFVFRDPSTYEEQERIFRARVTGLAERTPFSRLVYPSLPMGREMVRYQSGLQDFLSDAKIGAQLIATLAAGADAEEVKRRIRAMDLEARSVSDQLAEVQKIFLVVDVVLSSFGFLALLVATLGICNTQLMSISERTREIGIMKALGMTESTISRLFSLEALCIGLAGGLCGTSAAWLLGLIGNLLVPYWSELAASLHQYSAFVFPWWLLLGAPAFAGLIGCLAGIYPAHRAARLDPIEALRYE